MGLGEGVGGLALAVGAGVGGYPEFWLRFAAVSPIGCRNALRCRGYVGSKHCRSDNDWLMSK